MSHTINHNELILDKLNKFNLQKYENDKVSLSSPNGIAVCADTSPSPTLDTQDLRNGWLYHKIATNTNKFNYYFYGNTGSSYQYTLGDLKSVNFTASVDNYSSIASCPFIVVYSKPTGSNDSQVWYHSKRVFTININTTPIVVGEQVNFYSGEKIIMNNNNRYVELSIVLSEGDNLDTEEILYITLHSDSSAPINTKILTTHIGYNLKNEIIRNIKLV